MSTEKLSTSTKEVPKHRNALEEKYKQESKAEPEPLNPDNIQKQISDVRIHRGSNRNGIIASCIYKACRLQGCPRSAKEIADIFKLNISHMTKGCKKFDEIINMKQ